LTVTATLPERSKGGTSRRRVPKPQHRAPRWVERTFAPPATNGLRITLGVAWFAAVLAATAVGRWPLAGVLAAVAALGAAQNVHAWRRLGGSGNEAVAAIVAGGATLAAGWQAQAAAFVLFAGCAAAVVAAVVARRRRAPVLAAAGVTVRSFTVPVAATVGILLVYGVEPVAAGVLIVLLSAYDAGSFLVGAGERGPVAGIVAGIASVLVTAFPFALFVDILGLPPFDSWQAAWVFAGIIAALAPLGPALTSLALPSADADVRALRRIDVFVVAAPLWAWALLQYAA
jgi:hypothetical protein